MILYGGADENHEAAFSGQSIYSVIEGHEFHVAFQKESLIINWNVTNERIIMQVGQDLYLYLLSRDDVFKYWVLDLPKSSSTDRYAAANSTSIIVRAAGYLIRTAYIHGSNIALVGDVNTTTTIEVIGGAPDRESTMTFNQLLYNSQLSYYIIEQ